ncbi:MAG: pantoate--beta-alanine ligase [Actinomycetota bacterium]|nr:pantoate--beta-alanine ligase [Actinomycetota bacterium]
MTETFEQPDAISATKAGTVDGRSANALPNAEAMVVRTRQQLVAARAKLGDGDVGVVMTMGALHEGHATLIREARSSMRHVIVTIFLNPLQFGPHEDLARYPHTNEADLEICRREGVDLVFMPTPSVVYPDGDPLVRVSAGPLGNVLEGQARPGHFDGVLTVVGKLLHLTRADYAYFGQKDAQQLLLIRRMTSDLDFPVEVVSVATVREPDGLAMSSRNTYLGESDRETALCLHQALRAGAEAAVDGPSAVRRAARDVVVREPLALIDYLVLVDPLTLEDVPEWYRGEALLAIAGRVGTTRLIDNVPVNVGPGGGELEVSSEDAGRGRDPKDLTSPPS